MAKISCQDALAYAVKQAGKSPNTLQQLQEPPGLSGPWLQSTCAAPGVQQTGTFGVGRNTFGWASAICTGSDSLITSYYTYQYAGPSGYARAHAAASSRPALGCDWAPCAPPLRHTSLCCRTGWLLLYYTSNATGPFHGAGQKHARLVRGACACVCWGQLECQTPKNGRSGPRPAYACTCLPHCMPSSGAVAKPRELHLDGRRSGGRDLAKNYWRPDFVDSYIDPRTLCDIPHARLLGPVVAPPPGAPQGTRTAAASKRPGRAAVNMGPAHEQLPSEWPEQACNQRSE